MARVAFPLFLLVASCGPHVSLFDGFDAGSCDAGCASDGGMRDASTWPIGDPRFPEPGSEADFRTLAGALVGTYHGVSVRGPRATRFEIEFEADEQLGRGRFGVHCLDAPACQPFGPGSMPPPGGGRFDLVFIDTHAQGRGELSWGEPAIAEVEFWHMTHDERVLSFLVGYLGVSQEAGVYASIVLAPGGWPDGGDPFTQAADAGAGDADTDGAP
jgi:hypothetical protein